MFGSEFIIAQQTSSGPTKAISSPWFERKADNAIFTYYHIKSLHGVGALKVEVLHKNREDMGPDGDVVAATGDFVQESSSGIYWTNPPIRDIKELFRYKVYAAWATATPDAHYGAWFRILEPTWFNASTIYPEP